MKVLMLVFSPYQNSKNIGKKLEEKMVEKNIEVDFFDITRNKELWENKQYHKFFNEIKQHDVLCIGGPVYAHYLPKNFLEFISQIPYPDKTTFGKHVIIFVTYGGVSSGMALYDAAKTLIKRKRTNIMGLKINSSHSLSQSIPKSYIDNKSENEINGLLDDLVKRLVKLDLTKQRDVSESFNYQKNYVKPKEPDFPEIEINKRNCKSCGRCKEICPVQRIKLVDKTFSETDCIYCGQCYFNCNFDAINWNLDTFKPFLERIATLQKPLKEDAPYSSIYPI